jgi:hypothetical protein
LLGCGLLFEVSGATVFAIFRAVCDRSFSFFCYDIGWLATLNILHREEKNHYKMRGSYLLQVVIPVDEH